MKNSIEKLTNEEDTLSGFCGNTLPDSLSSSTLFFSLPLPSELFGLVFG